MSARTKWMAPHGTRPPRSISRDLAELTPLLGRWTFIGTFKDEPDTKVEGWERYEARDEGSCILSPWEVKTLRPGGTDVNKGTLKIAFNEKTKAITGADVDDGANDDEWVLSVEDNVYRVQNTSYRFTGTLDTRGDTISGKWETKGRRNRWRYWYDKVMTKVR